jgi:hypothetical protein
MKIRFQLGRIFLLHKFGMCNMQFKIRNSEFGIRNLEFRIQNLEFDTYRFPYALRASVSLWHESERHSQTHKLEGKSKQQEIRNVQYAIRNSKFGIRNLEFRI